MLDVKEEKPVNIVKRSAGFIMMSGGILFLIFGLLPTWVNQVKNDLKVLDEYSSTPAPALLPVLFGWVLSIGITGFVVLAVILGGLGLMAGPSKKKNLESTAEAANETKDNKGS